MQIHQLKTWPEYFQAVKSGKKTFEIRSCDDRTYRVGDILSLLEYDPVTDQFIGDEYRVKVSYVLPGGQFGIDKNACVMAIIPMMQ